MVSIIELYREIFLDFSVFVSIHFQTMLYVLNYVLCFIANIAYFVKVPTISVTALGKTLLAKRVAFAVAPTV